MGMGGNGNIRFSKIFPLSWVSHWMWRMIVLAMHFRPTITKKLTIKLRTSNGVRRHLQPASNIHAVCCLWDSDHIGLGPFRV